jgi:hypothetical protein
LGAVIDMVVGLFVWTRQTSTERRTSRAAEAAASRVKTERGRTTGKRFALEGAAAVQTGCDWLIAVENTKVYVFAVKTSRGSVEEGDDESGEHVKHKSGITIDRSLNVSKKGTIVVRIANWSSASTRDD